MVIVRVRDSVIGEATPQFTVPLAVKVKVTGPAPWAVTDQTKVVAPPGSTVSGAAGTGPSGRFTRAPPGPTNCVAVTPVIASAPVFVTVNASGKIWPTDTVDGYAASPANDDVPCNVADAVDQPRTALPHEVPDAVAEKT